LALADTQAIAFMLKIPQGTIWSWASRGHLTRRGTKNGRALYDVDEAADLAQRMARKQETTANGRAGGHP
jgi:hypothetical protein